MGTTYTNYVKVCERLLCGTPVGDGIIGNKLKVEWLERNVTIIDDDNDEESVQRYVRSYIPQLIGGCLFADKSNRFVYLMFLPLFEDFQIAGQYSWGNAAWLIYTGSYVADLALVRMRLQARQFLYSCVHGTDFHL
ncbi:hypothetical protein Scep_006544 [Stephania cephalantha]|uniref:Aminotransferase-like plant mobile domain-containing protein n=1 Tax=Stephania cephalantha TaxID=152367 RepID=A0AAP0PKX8_9MAGN